MGTLRTNVYQAIKSLGSGTCAEVNDWLNQEKIASGAVSTALMKLVNEGIISIHPTRTGPKGGKVYIFVKEIEKRKITIKFPTIHEPGSNH